MNRRKKSPFVALALFATSSVGFGQLSLSLWTDATYRQKSTTQTDFRGVGEFGVLLRDGNAIPDGCPLNGSLTWFAPNPLIGCPVGATVYVSIGDINPAAPTPGPSLTPPIAGDPSLINDVGTIGPIRVYNPDDLTYWEVPTEPVAAVAIAPSDAKDCGLYAAPPSKLPRPISTFYDETLAVYGNLETASVREYQMTRYRYNRTYSSPGNPVRPGNLGDTGTYTDGPAAGTAMRSEIAPGEYFFTFPYLGDPTSKARMSVIYRPIPEGYGKVGTITPGKISQGFRFTKLNGAPLVWSADGYVEMDPRLANTLEWEGNGIEVIFPTLDTVYLSVEDLGGTLPGLPDREIASPEVHLFPGFTAPAITRVLLPAALDTSYTIPPRSVHVTMPVTAANPAREGVVQITLERAVPTSSVSTDFSQRRFQMPVRFVDTYWGWASVTFPAGTRASAMLPTADPDGDGATNYQEWLANTNPMSALSKPAPPVIAFVQARAVRSIASAAPGHWETKMTKANVVPAITYEYEFSNDMQTWRTIGDNDPDWILTNDADPGGVIKVQSRTEQLVSPGFLRVKMTQDADPTPAPTPVSTQ